MKNNRKTTETFIKEATFKHNEKYDYSLVDYINSKVKVKIICYKHGVFEQTPDTHLCGSGCPICSGNVILNVNEFKIKANSKHTNKYDYSLVNYINGRGKVKIICKLHGEFEQRAENHVRGDGCPSCSGNKKLTVNDFIKKSRIKHKDRYNYSLVNYKNNSKKVKIICKLHGEFEQNPNNHINGNGCPKCKESKGEREIRNYLINNSINFIEQKRFSDCKDKQPLPFDFYLPNQNICVEFNGRQHYMSVPKWGGVSELKKIQRRDGIKIKYCKYNNIKLIIIKYNENIFNKLEKLINPKTQRSEF